jgi:hypothetical protein
MNTKRFVTVKAPDRVTVLATKDNVFAEPVVFVVRLQHKAR